MNGEVNPMKKGVKKKVLTGALILFTVVAAATGIFMGKGSMKSQTANAAPAEEKKPEVEKKAVNVAVQILELKNVEETFRGDELFEEVAHHFFRRERPASMGREGDAEFVLKAVDAFSHEDALAM